MAKSVTTPSRRNVGSADSPDQRPIQRATRSWKLETAPRLVHVPCPEWTVRTPGHANNVAGGRCTAGRPEVENHAPVTPHTPLPNIEDVSSVSLRFQPRAATGQTERSSPPPSPQPLSGRDRGLLGARLARVCDVHPSPVGEGLGIRAEREIGQVSGQNEQKGRG
jgi:hypothetical protein